MLGPNGPRRCKLHIGLRPVTEGVRVAKHNCAVAWDRATGFLLEHL